MHEPLIKNTPLVVALSIIALAVATMIGMYLSVKSQPAGLIGF